MSLQTANSTSDKNIFFLLPTTDTKRIISDTILTEDYSHSSEHLQYSPKVISILDKCPTVGSNFWVSNPSPSEVAKAETFEQSRVFKINILQTKKLKEPIEAILEPDDEGYIIRTIDLPLFGYGDDPIEAIQNLKSEIESLYDDLMMDDNFSDEWLRYKNFLKKIICEY